MSNKRSLDNAGQPCKKRVTIVYTDGACTENGGKNAKAGIGIYFGRDDPRNVSRPLTVKGLHTNQRAELAAIQEALVITKDDESVDIRTDSQYSISCFTEWLVGWESRGWRNSKNKPVMNQDLIKPIACLIKSRAARKLGFQFTKVKGHSGIFGNDEADRLATSAISSPQLDKKEIRK